MDEDFTEDMRDDPIHSLDDDEWATLMEVMSHQYAGLYGAIPAMVDSVLIYNE